MKNIKTISMEELKKDLQESKKDIQICKGALLNNINNYSGGSVQKRLDTNKRIVIKITQELNRRKQGK